EAERVAKVLNCSTQAADLCNTLQIEQVVIHATEHADAATLHTTAHVSGPHVEKTIITTGGGDNFNAGYILGLGMGLPLEETLRLATHTSGYYVKFGKSPTLNALKSYMRQDQKKSPTIKTVER
ncbi:MAG: PfkB family carbohydrate kinase, partial [Chlamydiales bacterium]|nr:PfkB family carbohydrate kinase [Chlamydiales bacterium]